LRPRGRATRRSAGPVGGERRARSRRVRRAPPGPWGSRILQRQREVRIARICCFVPKARLAFAGVAVARSAVVRASPPLALDLDHHLDPRSTRRRAGIGSRVDSVRSRAGVPCTSWTRPERRRLTTPPSNAHEPARVEADTSSRSVPRQLPAPGSRRVLVACIRTPAASEGLSTPPRRARRLARCRARDREAELEDHFLRAPRWSRAGSERSRRRSFAGQHDDAKATGPPLSFLDEGASTCGLRVEV